MPSTFHSSPSLATASRLTSTMRSPEWATSISTGSPADAGT